MRCLASCSAAFLRLCSSFLLTGGFLFVCLNAQARVHTDLNGSWQYQIVSEIIYPPLGNWVNTTVPDLVSSTNYAKAWFRKTFVLPNIPPAHRVKLQFGGVKYNSTVYLNGQAIGGCYNGYDPFELDATLAALPGQVNTLLVAVTDWTGLFSSYVDFSNLQPGESARDRAQNVVLAPIGGHFSRFGIWEGVAVEYVPDLSLADVFVTTSVRQQQLSARARVRNESPQPVSGRVIFRVLDGGNPVLELPGQEFSLPAGQSLNVVSSADWSSPQLWSPEDPHLYNLESSIQVSGSTNDLIATRFGFREFWCASDSFFLNGTKIHLLAASCWPPTTPTSDSTIRQSLSQVKSGNNKALRLHTQPWPKAWYRIADEVGLLIVEEAAVWCDPRAYRLSDPVFWTNYADHLRAMVRRDANHPSLIMWSLENEILHCGGNNLFAGTITNLANLGLLVKSLDPTRPITFEADLDPGGVADVIGLHYPHEFPDHAFWPNTAYWMDQPLSKSYAPGGQWLWDRNKPLYIGEYLWVPDTAPEGLSILFGDMAYFDRSLYRQKAKAVTWQMQIEAYRSYGVSAHCPWTMVEDPAGSGIQNLNTNQNTLYKLQSAAYDPNAVVIREYDRRFFTGESVPRTLTIYNDTAATNDLLLEWSVNGAGGSGSFSLGPAEQRVETIHFTAPSTPGAFNLELTLRNSGSLVFSNALACAAFTPTQLSIPAGRRVGLYDPAGSTSTLFAGLNYEVVTDLAGAPYKNLDLLIVGRNALQPENPPAVGSSTTAAQWQSFMDRGGWVLILEQTNYPSWLPLGLGLVNETASYSFPVADHPLINGFDPESFRWWRGDNAVVSAAITIPARGNFRPVVHVGSRQGLDRAALLEAPVGRGGLLCSQLLLVEKAGTEPMAAQLLQQLLHYTPENPPPHYAGLLAEPGAPAVTALERVGLVAENISGALANTDRTRFPVIIVAGTNDAWTEATAGLNQLQSYVQQGGRLLLHRPSDAFLAAAGSLLPGVSWASDVSLPIVRSDTANAPRTFTNHDLHWADDPGNWNRQERLATNIATRVYRKNFNLSSYTTLQVENMPTKTTGSPVTGGWCLYADGYVAQNITITQPGAYLFGVLARGTPLGGVYPHMTLRIDGQFADAVTVTSSTWQLFTLSGNLPAGTHELALVFDNDAYAPPEDRNLYLDQVRYGLDPAPSVPRLLTKPGAVVENPHGAGTVLFDEIAWENAGMHATRAERYLSTLLTSHGAWLQSPAALQIQAEAMQPIGVSVIRTNNGVVWLSSAGRLQATVRFTDTGFYLFTLRGYGTPALGVYPRAELRVDNVVRGVVDLNASQPETFSILAYIPAGTRTLAIAFINDYYDPPEDRNMALDYFTVQPQPQPRILDLIMQPESGRAILVWQSKPGKDYAIQYAPSLAGPWTDSPAVTALGTACSWTDDGSFTGQPPGSPQRPHAFYRVRQLP